MIASAALPAEAAVPEEHHVRYHGTGGSLFVLIVKNLLLTLVTLGIYLPWARTERRKYLWQNLEFAGQRFRYHGTGREMFLGYLKVLLVYGVLIGLPELIAQVDPEVGSVLRIVGFLVLLPLIPVAIYSSRRYLLSRTTLRGIRFGLQPGVWAYTGKFIGGYLLTVISVGLYGPVWLNNLRAFVTRHTRFGSQAFDYDGSNHDAWNLTMKGVLLSIVTLGIYYPWYLAAMARFGTEHTRFGAARGRLDLGGLDMLVILLVSTFGVVFSLGLAFPWITTYVLQTITSRMSMVGPIDFAAIAQTAPSGDAAGDAFADALDVGLGI